MPEQVVTHENVLVPTDGSRAAKGAAEQAVALAGESGGRVHALYVMDMGDAAFVATPSDIGETRRRLEKKGQEYTDFARELAEEAGVPCETEVRSGIPEEEIVDIRRTLEEEPTTDRRYTVDLVGEEGEVHATVEKVVHVRKSEEPG